MTERIYCSELAKSGRCALHGSAVHVEVWLLIEYSRPWSPKAIADNDLSFDVNARLAELPEMLSQLGVKLRIQWIKQTSSADVDHPRIFVVDARSGKLRGGVLKSHTEISQLNEAVILGAEPLPGEKDRSMWADEDLLLVCTNGQRDLCCARFGLPVFEVLARAYGMRVWQTTHVGGHRYAPNLVCLPSGIVYGHVHPDQVSDLVTRHDAGEVVLENLRGRSSLSGAAQAAEYYILAEIGATHAVELTRDGTDIFQWQCRKTGDKGMVTVAARELPGIIASCGADPKTDYEYELVDLKR